MGTSQQHLTCAPCGVCTLYQLLATAAGLCCAALLARYGYSVTVVESHYLPGETSQARLASVHHICPAGCLVQSSQEQA